MVAFCLTKSQIFFFNDVYTTIINPPIQSMALSSSVSLSNSSLANESIRISPIFFSSSSSSVQFPTKPTSQNLSNKPLTRQCSSKRSTKTKVSFFPAFLTKSKDAKTLKLELLEAIQSLDRGADATPEDQQRIDQVVISSILLSPEFVISFDYEILVYLFSFWMLYGCFNIM